MITFLFYSLGFYHLRILIICRRFSKISQQQLSSMKHTSMPDSLLDLSLLSHVIFGQPYEGDIIVLSEMRTFKLS